MSYAARIHQMNSDLGKMLSHARLEDAAPIPTSREGYVAYFFELERGTTLDWYTRFREQLERLDGRIQLPLWPNAQRRESATVQAPDDIPRDEFVAYFEFAAKRADSA